MKWQLGERGFLPTPDPVTRLDGAAFEPIEQLAAELPALVYERRLREIAPERLRPVANTPPPAEDGPRTERLFMLYSYFAAPSSTPRVCRRSSGCRANRRAAGPRRRGVWPAADPFLRILLPAQLAACRPGRPDRAGESPPATELLPAGRGQGGRGLVYPGSRRDRSPRRRRPARRSPTPSAVLADDDAAGMERVLTTVGAQPRRNEPHDGAMPRAAGLRSIS